MLQVCCQKDLGEFFWSSSYADKVILVHCDPWWCDITLHIECHEKTQPRRLAVLSIFNYILLTKLLATGHAMNHIEFQMAVVSAVRRIRRRIVSQLCIMKNSQTKAPQHARMSPGLLPIICYQGCTFHWMANSKTLDDKLIGVKDVAIARTAKCVPEWLKLYRIVAEGDFDLSTHSLSEIHCFWWQRPHIALYEDLKTGLCFNSHVCICWQLVHLAIHSQYSSLIKTHDRAC